MTLRFVLDTNVWLDWLVFDDPRTAPLRAAVTARRAEIWLDAAGEEELTRVLAYPLRKHGLEPAAQAACLVECRRVACVVPAGVRGAGVVLPQCRDPNDQKFLEFTCACGADYLVSKDLELLALARHEGLPFRIVTLEEVEEILKNT